MLLCPVRLMVPEPVPPTPNIVSPFATMTLELLDDRFLIMLTKPSRAANCALYARAETGVSLFGAAGGWWDQAEGRYERGNMPAVGAILVFKRTRQIPSGHVAVVARIISAHEILVDHANWYHGTVSRGMSVIDTSPAHDWTSVAVIDPPSGTHGQDYPTYGFVYPGQGPREIAEIPSQGGLGYYLANTRHFADFSSGSALCALQSLPSISWVLFALRRRCGEIISASQRLPTRSTNQ